MKNLWLNIAVPSIMQTEPGDVPQLKIHETLTVTVWDRWEFFDVSKDKMTVKGLVEQVLKRYGIYVQNIMIKQTFLWQKLLDKDQTVFNSLLDEILNLEKGQYRDIILVCTLTEEPSKEDKDVQEKEEYIQNLPFVRLCNFAEPEFKKKEREEEEMKKYEK